jgi:hypothetical protein
VALAVGIALAIWGSQRETRRVQEIRPAVAAMIEAVCGGNDDHWLLSSASAVIRPALRDKLRETCSARGSALSVEVVPGDPNGPASQRGAATHTALIRVGATDVLGLRIKHGSPSGAGAGAGAKETIILGYFVPQPIPSAAAP